MLKYLKEAFWGEASLATGAFLTMTGALLLRHTSLTTLSIVVFTVGGLLMLVRLTRTFLDFVKEQDEHKK